MAEDDDDLETEYDMDEVLKDARPNRFAATYAQEANLVALAPDVAKEFPNAESVNEALRLVIKIRELETRPNAVAEK